MSEIFIRMLEVTAVSSAIILAVFIFRMLLAKKVKPGVIGMLWALVLLRLCLPVTLESPVHLPQPIPQRQDSIAEQPLNDNIPDTADIPGYYNAYMPEAEYVPETQHEFTTQAYTANVPAAGEQPVTADFSVDWLAIAAYVWIAGAAAILLSAVWKGVSFGRSIKRCGEYEEAGFIVREIKLTLKIRRNVPVKVCADITAPVLFGCFRPQILLPKSCCSADNETLRCILTHELCHVKRHDILKGYIWLIAKAVHWFNPLVWFAYILFKDDIELGCDDMVLRYLGTENRFAYTQSLIDVFRYYRRQLPLAVPLFESKPKLTERVIRMLKPHKHSKTIAVLSVLLVLVILVAGFTTACSPAAAMEAMNTPQQTEMQQPTTEPTDTLEPTPAPTPELYKTEQWTDKAEQGPLTIDINAGIVTPDVSSFPIYNVKDAAISQDTVDNLKQFFFGDTTIYEYTNRMMYEKDLKDSNEIYAAMQDGTYEFSENDDKEEFISDMKAHIRSVERSLKKEPDTGLVPLDMTLANMEYGKEGITEAGDSINISKSAVYFSKYDPNIERDVNLKFIKQPQPAVITREEAIAKAEALLKELGLTDFRFYKDKSAFIRENLDYTNHVLNNSQNVHPYVYGLVFTRVVDGIQLASVYSQPDIDNDDLKTANKLADNFTEETIMITVNDSGIRSFNWRAPFITETVNNSTQLKNIEDIKQTVIEQLMKKYENKGKNDNTDTKNDDEYYRLENYTLHVNTMKLEYARVPVGGDYDTPYLVPVWNVYSTYTESSWRKENGKEVMSDHESTFTNLELTINALDGSVIGTTSNYN